MKTVVAVKRTRPASTAAQKLTADELMPFNRSVAASVSCHIHHCIFHTFCLVDVVVELSKRKSEAKPRESPQEKGGPALIAP